MNFLPFYWGTVGVVDGFVGGHSEVVPELGSGVGAIYSEINCTKNKNMIIENLRNYTIFIISELE